MRRIGRAGGDDTKELCMLSISGVGVFCYEIPAAAGPAGGVARPASGCRQARHS
jgi:hypothetical protein